MHGSELELSLGAHTLGEGSVVDHVAESLTINPEDSNLVAAQLFHGDLGWNYRSGSNCSKTFRLVWSRTTRGLMNPPRSRILDRKCDMLTW